MTPKISRLALALVLATGVVGTVTVTDSAVAQRNNREKAPAAPKPQFTKEVQNALAEAQKLEQKGDLDGAQAKLNEALAGAQTPDDKFYGGQMLYNVGVAKKDNAIIEKSTLAMLESGKANDDAALHGQLLQNAAAFALQRQDNAAALKYYEQLVQLQPGDGDAIVGLAELYAQSNNSAQAVTTLQRAIDAKKAEGEAVPETWYKRMLAIAYDAKRNDLVTSASMALVAAYPTPDNWRDSLVLFKTGTQIDDQTNLDVMRLQKAASALKGESDYYEYADLAYRRGLYGESKAVIDAGVAANQVSLTKDTFKELNGLASGRIAADKASLGKFETAAKAAANGREALATGDAFLNYGDNAKAAEMYRLALTKGGVDADVANTRLGIALANSGDKAGASEAFAKVTNGARAQVAQFWNAWVKTPA